MTGTACSRVSTDVLSALGDKTITSSVNPAAYQEELLDDDYDDDISTFDTYERVQYNPNDELMTAHDGSNDPMTRK